MNISDMHSSILVFAESEGTHVSRLSLELISGAKRLANQSGGHTAVLLTGTSDGKIASELLAAGADKIFLSREIALNILPSIACVAALLAAVRQLEPSLILFGSTCLGMEVAPALAAFLDTGLITDCTGLRYDGKAAEKAISLGHDKKQNSQNARSETVTSPWILERPAADSRSVHRLRVCLRSGGSSSLLCENLPHSFTPPAIASVRPGVFSLLTEEEKTLLSPPLSFSRAATFLDMDPFVLSFFQGCARFLSEEEKPAETDITKVPVLVAGGRGMGSAEAFQTLSSLASLLGGTVACSRACVESGWADSSRQVGQTGKTVRPNLYLACGISGAIQHTAGMDQSRLIISINKNPAAPIFDRSDLGIVGNVEVILPKLIHALEEERFAGNHTKPSL